MTLEDEIKPDDNIADYRSSHSKKLNQHFFDSGNESREMFYVLGAMYSCCTVSQAGRKQDSNSNINPNKKDTQKKDSGNLLTIQSSHKDLLLRIKEALNSEHAIVEYANKHSYSIAIKGAKHLKHRLEELGLGLPKSEREFPEINENIVNHENALTQSNQNYPGIYLSHFLRGFVDGQRIICYKEQVKRKAHFRLLYNSEFVTRAAELLSEYAGVEIRKPENSSIMYLKKEIGKIKSFLYQDWEYVQEHRLYIPSRLEQFNMLSDAGCKCEELGLLDQNNNRRNFQAMQNKECASIKVDLAKKLLSEGLSGTKVSKKLGYTQATTLYRAFQKATGQTVNEYVGRKKHSH